MSGIDAPLPHTGCGTDECCGKCGNTTVYRSENSEAHGAFKNTTVHNGTRFDCFICGCGPGEPHREPLPREPGRG